MNKQEITRIRYTTDAVIDQILNDPGIKQGDLAAMFGYSQTSMSIIVNSDAFKERLAERKGELTDPILMASINERLDSVAKRSLDKIMERLDSPTSGSIKNADLIAMAKLGVGDKNTRPAGPQVQQNLYVVALPPPARDSTHWLSQLSNPRGPSQIIENEAPG